MSIVGTHNGTLAKEARERRRVKNDRREHRQPDRNEGLTVRGSYRWATRLWIMGNKDKRR